MVGVGIRVQVRIRSSVRNVGKGACLGVRLEVNRFGENEFGAEDGQRGVREVERVRDAWGG